MTPKTILGIHIFLHENAPGSEFHFSTNDPKNKLHKLQIKKTTSLCRYMHHEGITFVEQPKKDTFYGQLAIRGHKITWGYLGKNPTPIIRLVDGVLYIHGKKWDGGEVVIKGSYD